MPTLRPYQLKLKTEINLAWAQLSAAGNATPVVLAVSPTGTGKTVLFSEVMRDEPGASCAVAHRKEITAQISLALAKNGVRHRIIGSSKTRKACAGVHLRRLKRSFVDPNAKCGVAGIDTLINVKPTDPDWQWLQQVKLWVGDEGHHFLRENKWGRGIAMLPNARGLLVTAETGRADGKGLGRHADGVADAMVLGPTMREAITWGYLVDYVIAMPEGDVDISAVEISKTTGDFNYSQLRNAFHESKKICGNTVKAYQQHAAGKLAVVFAVDVEEATKMAREFRDAGVPAQMVSADTDDELRDRTLRQFEARELLVLVNVDLFGEGFDMPNIECVIMARHTESFNLYKQQWGRGTRLDIPAEWMRAWDDYTPEQRLHMISISAKPHMILIDMVGNVLRHQGPPDKAGRGQSLDGRRFGRSSAKSDAIPIRVCLNKNANGSGLACAQPYERWLHKCPHCGFSPEPASRASPEAVDGNVLLLDAATMATLRGEIARVDADASTAAYGSDVVANSIRRRQWERQQSQEGLRRAIAWWAGFEVANGRTHPGEQYSRFYLLFGADVLTAQTLGAREADELRLKISNHLALLGIDATVSID